MYYYNNELPPQQGWICPKCGRVNAPWLPTCGCISSQTSGSSYLVKTSSISRDSHEITKDESQFAKDINVRSKDEPQIDCNGCRHYADGTINKAVCDDCKRSHLDNYEPQTVIGNKAELTIKDGVVKATPIFEDEPQTKCSICYHDKYCDIHNPSHDFCQFEPQTKRSE